MHDRKCRVQCTICQHRLTKGAMPEHCRKKHKSLKKNEWKTKFKIPDEYPLKDFENFRKLLDSDSKHFPGMELKVIFQLYLIVKYCL